jgi:hypothetical protein
LRRPQKWGDLIAPNFGGIRRNQKWIERKVEPKGDALKVEDIKFKDGLAGGVLIFEDTKDNSRLGFFQNRTPKIRSPIQQDKILSKNH